MCGGEGSLATRLSVLCRGWAQLPGHPSHGSRPVPCGGGCQSPVSLRTPGLRLAHPPPSYPREANRRGAGSWWWRMRRYSGQAGRWRMIQAGLACLGSPPRAPGRVGGNSSPSKPVAGRPRLRQTSNICLEPSLFQPSPLFTRIIFIKGIDTYGEEVEQRARDCREKQGRASFQSSC